MRLLALQQVELDFRYSQVHINTDIPALILSDKKSLLQHKARIELHAEDPSSLGHVVDVPEELVVQFRQYLSLVREMDCELGSESEELVNELISQIRQSGGRILEEVLHTRIAMARLIAKSFLEPSLTRERWNQMKGLSLRTEFV